MKHKSIQNQPEVISGGRKFIRVPVKSALPYWGAATVWLLFGLCMPMYKIGVFILCILLSVAVAVWIYKKVPKEYREKEIPFSSGNLELDNCVKNLNDTLQSIDKARLPVAAIKPDTAKRMLNIQNLIAKIRDAVIKNPDFIPELRRFFEYYLPTTVKLTDKYAYCVLQNSDAENIQKTVCEIEKALIMIETAFDKQLNSLFEDDTLDITTDITVLETMMKQDNLN